MCYYNGNFSWINVSSTPFNKVKELFGTDVYWSFVLTVSGFEDNINFLIWMIKQYIKTM